jgi:uncharacterized membrane protein YbhN (UPF0104 family)
MSPTTTQPDKGAATVPRTSKDRSRDGCPLSGGPPARDIRRPTPRTLDEPRAGVRDAGTAAPLPSRPATANNATLRRRFAVVVLLGTAMVTLLLAIPPLRGVARQIAEMTVGWVGVAVAAELASCASFVVIFRKLFDEVPAGIARELAWTEEGSGALLPTGGVGALAIGAWLLRRLGMSTRTIVERSSALFFLTSATNVAALVGGGALLATGAMGGRDGLLLAGIPIVVGIVATSATLALPIALRRATHRTWPTWLIDVAAGIDGARRALLSPSWRLLGAIGYLGFDIAALGATFAATGHAVPIPVLVLGYVIGYLGNLIPIPGGVGVLEAGLAGTLIAYGAPATQAAAAVLVYHAIAFWIPSLGGLIGYALLNRRNGEAVLRTDLSATHQAPLDPALDRAA